MGQETDDIRKHIETKRSELTQSLNELEGRVRTITDWRHQVREHTRVAVGAAFGAGLIFSLLL